MKEKISVVKIEPMVKQRLRFVPNQPNFVEVQEIEEVIEDGVVVQRVNLVKKYKRDLNKGLTCDDFSLQSMIKAGSLPSKPSQYVGDSNLDSTIAAIDAASKIE